jgi:hypothetical protein
MTRTCFRWWAQALLAVVLAPAAGVCEELMASEPSQLTPATVHKPGAIRGVWDSVVTIQVCNGGPTLRTFRALNLFERDGSLVATSEVARPPSLGKWLWLGGRKFRAMFRFQRFGAGDVFEGVTEVTREIEVAPGGKSFTGVVSTTTYDITGTLMAQGCGKEEATRIF